MTPLVKFENMTDEEKAEVEKQARRQIAKFIAFKVGTAVAIHLAVRYAVKKLEENEKED